MRQVARALLRNDEGKYLLVMHHKSDTWTTPGGHIDPEEPIHKALKREIKEEFNMKCRFIGEVEDLGLDYIKQYPTPIANYKIYYTSKKFGKVKKWEFIFHCELKAWEIEKIKIQEKEIKKYHWFSAEEIMKLENIFPQIPLLLKTVVL